MEHRDLSLPKKDKLFPPLSVRFLCSSGKCRSRDDSGATQRASLAPQILLATKWGAALIEFNALFWFVYSNLLLCS